LASLLTAKSERSRSIHRVIPGHRQANVTALGLIVRRAAAVFVDAVALEIVGAGIDGGIAIIAITR
jgi:hypothetical protein